MRHEFGWSPSFLHTNEREKCTCHLWISHTTHIDHTEHMHISSSILYFKYNFNQSRHGTSLHFTHFLKLHKSAFLESNFQDCSLSSITLGFHFKNRKPSYQVKVRMSGANTTFALPSLGHSPEDIPGHLWPHAIWAYLSTCKHHCYIDIMYEGFAQDNDVTLCI